MKKNDCDCRACLFRPFKNKLCDNCYTKIVIGSVFKIPEICAKCYKVYEKVLTKEACLDIVAKQLLEERKRKRKISQYIREGRAVKTKRPYVKTGIKRAEKVYNRWQIGILSFLLLFIGYLTYII